MAYDLDYFSRLNKSDTARNLLALNGVLRPGDKLVSLCFIPGAIDLTLVVAGKSVEEYVVVQLLRNKELCDKFDRVRVYFVDLEEMVYRVATPEYVVSHIVSHLPSRKEGNSNSCFIIDVSALEAIHFEVGIESNKNKAVR